MTENVNAVVDDDAEVDEHNVDNRDEDLVVFVDALAEGEGKGDNAVVNVVVMMMMTILMVRMMITMIYSTYLVRMGVLVPWDSTYS